MSTEFFFRGEMVQLKNFHAEIIVHLLRAEAVRRTDPFSEKALRAWNATIVLAQTGCMDLELDQLLESNSDRPAFLDILAAAKARLCNFGDEIPTLEVKRLLNYDAASRPIETSQMIGAIERIRLMVEKSLD